MKFEVFQSPKNKKHYFHLKARNGQIILQSQGYASKSGAVKGAQSVQNNCADDKCYDRKVAKNGKHHFNLLSRNKQIVGSSQLYTSKASMENGIRSVKNVAPQASIESL